MRYDEILIDQLAKIAFESQMEDSWHDLRIGAIERTMWKNTIREILKALNRRKLLNEI